MNLTETHRKNLAAFEEAAYNTFKNVQKFPPKEQLQKLHQLAEVVSTMIRALHERPGEK